MEELNTLGERLTYLRKQAGLSQSALSKKLDGFNRDHISNLERDHVTQPKRELISQIVEYFRTTYEWLERGEGPTHKHQDDVVGMNTADPAEQYGNPHPTQRIIDQLRQDDGDPSSLDYLRSEVGALIRDIKNKDQQIQELRKQLFQALEAYEQLKKKFNA